MLGARTIITSSSDQKLAKMQDIGADLCINYTKNPDWDKDVLDATGGEGANLILEVGGADTLARSMQCVSTNGQIALIGMVSGSQQVNLQPLLTRAASVRGIYVGNRRMFSEMIAAIDHNGMEPIIDRVFDFEDAPAAYRHLRSGTHVGKIVISQTGPSGK
jgi:NADPH:quinone reductase-like Zn-dependent oxidoreductase